MWPRPPRALGLVLVVGCALGATWCSSSTPSSPSTTTPPVAGQPPVVEVPVNESPISTTPTSPPAGSVWINVFGDTGWCGSPVMAQLAQLMERLGGDLLLAGDLAYDRGTPDEFRRCFDPAFGRFRTRFWAAPGNHDYLTPGATGYFGYFGDRAGADRTGYYALRLASWHVLMLNSNVAMGRGSPQIEWVRQELASSSARCTLAVWHHPFDSSGPNGPHPEQRDLWELLHARGVDVVVSGHDHLYERHAPMDANQRSDPARGIRLFISGGGGAPSYQRARAAIRSELMISTHGLLRLKLEPALYEWEYLAPNGTVLDRGLNVCH
jgi:acid phosphatase type 7